jgi:hypothetical protein
MTKVIGGRVEQIVMGNTSISEKIRSQYIEKLNAAGFLSPDFLANLPAVQDSHQRPGDVLHGLLRTRHGVTIASCKCQNLIDKMNVWGPDGCRENRETIVYVGGAVCVIALVVSFIILGVEYAKGKPISTTDIKQ